MRYGKVKATKERIKTMTKKTEKTENHATSQGVNSSVLLGYQSHEISKEVEKLEDKLNDYKGLTGQILATLQVNIDRENLRFITGDAQNKFNLILQQWIKWHQELIA